MEESASQHPFPNDYWAAHENAPTTNARRGQRNKQQGEAFPVDETEEFNDPYSELNLFLSKKIKKEMQKRGSSKNWSNKIQEDLLHTILPEFKKAFPKYRLGASALKKMWEKVSYYYKRVHAQKGAVQKNGALDIYYMIRENLRHNPQTKAPPHLPPYNMAHNLAIKLSECIATLDSVRPNLDLLTRTIWAAQKHLLQNLSPQSAKSPFEEYTKEDKIVIKTILEITSHSETLTPEALARSVRETLEEYTRIDSLCQKNTLYSTLSALFAKKQIACNGIQRTFTDAQKRTLNAFITRQFAILNQYKDFSIDTKRVELVSRILALYPLANALPRDIKEEDMHAAIAYVYATNTGTPPQNIPAIDQRLIVFINTEMHLYPNKTPGEVPAHIKEEIAHAYSLATALPQLPNEALKELEIYAWDYLESSLEILKHIPSHLQEMLFTELGNNFIDHPTQTLKGLVNETAQFLKKVREVARKGSDADNHLAQKTYIWSLQQEMLCRYIHFDPKTKLLEMLLDYWKAQGCDERSVDHEACKRELLERALERYPHYEAFREILKTRISILYKYLWYNLFSQTSETTYSRFLQYWEASFKAQYPELSAKERREKLKKHSERVLPLLPFPEEQQQAAANDGQA